MNFKLFALALICVGSLSLCAMDEGTIITDDAPVTIDDVGPDLTTTRR